MAKQSKQYGADSIRVLEGLEAVRMRPEMYIGSTGKRGLNHLVFEILDNAVDEHLAGYGDQIWVVLNKDGSCTVKDEGRGVPVDIHKQKKLPAARVVFTTLHAGGKFDNNLYKTAGGLHGVGSSAVNALSSWFDVKIARDGKLSHDYYEKGKPKLALEDHHLPILKKVKYTGTEITFLPDSSIFAKIDFGATEICKRLHETAYLNPDLTIYFENQRKGEETSLVYHEPEGLSAFMRELNKNAEPLSDDIVCLEGQDEGIRMRAVIQYTNDFHENIIGFCNNICTQEGGTHITGFKSAFTSVMNQYAKEIGVIKEKSPFFSGQEIRSGMTAIVSISHPTPRFEGQTKTKLDNPDAQRACSKIVTEQARYFFDKNLALLKKILESAQRAQKLHKAEEKTKNSFLPKPKFTVDSNGKLSGCTSRKPEECEIFIVEGDSAGGSAKMARNRQFQAILPIRGKILNVEKASMDKILGNAEIKTMIYAFGCGFSEGYGQDFDISKLRYHKIIIMTDADVDGAHISTLLLTFFYRFMPELIYQGHIYLAMAPLYKAIPKKGNEVYLYDDASLAKYRKSHKNFFLQRYKGLGEMDAQQLWETTLNPETRQLKQITIEDGIAANQITSILMGNDAESRKQFIESHAHFADVDT